MKLMLVKALSMQDLDDILKLGLDLILINIGRHRYSTAVLRSLFPSRSLSWGIKRLGPIVCYTKQLIK
ncbi:hypothetical protein Scep_021528 [Stephania cephalantha]|uniref:Uncharacterized protein n=1 Tax=Stephania cephalantha TaxID=152367 RepID=A0AAP0I1Y2_9MAGN